jgi:hypothetical protein
MPDDDSQHATTLSYPESVKDDIDKRDERTVCGGYFTVVWKAGPKKGLPVTLYCAEPMCINEGVCTGQRFVPHMQQYTTLDTNDPRWGPRQLDPGEIIEAVRHVAKKAREHGARPQEWSDRTIARYVGTVWKKTLRAIRGEGGWTQ